MKKTTLFAAFLLLTLVSGAQGSLAITGGLQGTSVTPNFLTYPDTVNKTSLNKARVTFGFVANVPITGGLFFRTGVLYSAKGSNWSQFYDTANVYREKKAQLLTSKTELNVNYIDIPVNLLYKLPLKKKTRFIVGGGPQLSLLYTGDKTYSTTSVTQPKLDEEAKLEYKQDVNKDLPIGHIPGRYRIVHVGANAFAGLEFNRVFLTANYSRGLGAFYEEEDRQYKHQTIGASIGIYLGKQQSAPAKKVVQPAPPAPLPPQPKDSDGDGVNDEVDQCPQVAGLARYNGCPIPDTDGDGVNDEQDQCKDLAGLARYGGCPVPDSDKDGINDEQDKCPQVAGTADNAGCPAIKEEVTRKIEYAAKNIYFNTNSAKLLSKSYAQLDEVVKILNEDPHLKLSIEGHTDDTGTGEVNQAMSEARAKAVEAYLVSKGIDEARITAQGFGESRPIADNKTAEGRAKNRRVVLQVNY